MATDYCSKISIESDEGLFATASYCKRLLLIEYNAVWGAEPVHQNKMPPATKHFLAETTKLPGIRVLLIKNSERIKEQINVFAVTIDEAKPFINQFVINHYQQLENIGIDRLFEQDAKNAYKEDILLVCTNGKKDMCCSKFGIPIYNGLKNLKSSVWECTHVGGDRFAPNVLHLPFGHVYGHLQNFDLPHLCKAFEKKEIYFKNYRGRTCYQFYEQAAEFFLRKELNSFSFLALKKLNSSRLTANRYRIRFNVPSKNKDFDITISSKTSETRAFLTCKAFNESTRLLFNLESITTAEAEV